MNDQVPPTFNFSPGIAECCNYLRFLNVYEIPPENQSVRWSAKAPRENIHLWEIAPKDVNYVEGRNLPVITYGKIPPGWVQKFPESGEPLPLLEGHVYEAGGPQVEVPQAFMRFAIRNGKAVRIPIPGFME